VLRFVSTVGPKGLFIKKPKAIFDVSAAIGPVITGSNHVLIVNVPIPTPFGLEIGWPMGRWTIAWYEVSSCLTPEILEVDVI
jgi:hypothetical protein